MTRCTNRNEEHYRSDRVVLCGIQKLRLLSLRLVAGGTPGALGTLYGLFNCRTGTPMAEADKLR